MKIILIAGVPLSQALPGYLITALPSVCVSAVIGVLAVWIQNITKTAGVPSSQALLGFLITAPPSVCVSAVLDSLAVWIQKPKKYIYTYVYLYNVYPPSSGPLAYLSPANK